jgi:hypothetical protein
LARLLLNSVTEWMHEPLRLHAQAERMTLKPDNRALRVLLWFVILFVPGGMILLAWVAAEMVHRRYREDVVAPDPKLAGAALSGTSLSGELRSGV